MCVDVLLQPLIVSAEQCNRGCRADAPDILLNPARLVAKGFCRAFGNQHVCQGLVRCEVDFAFEMDMAEFFVCNVEIHAVDT